MNRFKIILLPSVLVALLAVLLLRTSMVSAAPASGCGNWNIVPSPNYSQESNNVLKGVAALSANDVWTVGFALKYHVFQRTLIEHWNGNNWNIVASPAAKGANFFEGVAAVSTNDIWAVGAFTLPHGIEQTLIEHWNGSHWSIIPSPNVASSYNILYGVAAISTNDVWAVGDFTHPTAHTLIEHWDGIRWSIVSSPNRAFDNILLGVTALSTNDVWTVGYTIDASGVERTLTEHWDGTRWSLITSPTAGRSSLLNGVAAVSSSDVWAVGYIIVKNSDINNMLIEHWNGTQWSVVASPNAGKKGSMLNGVAVVSANNVWTVGNSGIYNYNDKTLIEHWDGTKWSVVASPNVGSDVNDLSGAALVTGTTHVWIVGYFYTGIPTRTLTEFYC